MGLRLRFLAWWTPQFFIKRELGYISKSTAFTLRSLVAGQSADSPSRTYGGTNPLHGTVSQMREAMAQEHAELVDALTDTVGRDEAVKLGRAALFELGKTLGEETRARLGVGSSPEDLVRAATILYMILGIDFRVEWIEDTRGLLIVNRCELARRYSAVTCLVLSAIDEGVIHGMNPKASMMFRERMTTGCQECRAEIRFNQPEAH